MKSKGIRALVIVLSCVVALVAVAAISLNAMLPAEGKIAEGVKMAGEDVGQMTREEVEELFLDSDCYSGKTVVFTGEPDTEEISGEHIGLSVDAKASAEKAYLLCRGDNWLENAVNAVKIRFGGAELNLVPTANEALDEIIYQRGVRKNGEMQELGFEEVSDTEIRVIPAVAGQSKDVSKEREAVLFQIENGNEDAITLDLSKSQTEPLTAKQLSDMLYIEPVNAEYTIENKRMNITDEVVGRSADMTEIEQKIELFNSGEAITLTVTKNLPEVTAESLNKELFSSELASYSSKYSTGAVNRSFNVSRAASSVNGTILMPGEVFSYNDTIGNPSLANGYKMATVFENGRQTEGVGGGVCQVSSTLYSAALYANLEIVERRSHSLTVAYVPKGQDATVSYGAVDFKFKNSTQNPIKIEAFASGGVCKVRILGTRTVANQTVEIKNSIVSVLQPATNETVDPTLPEGTRKVTSSGKTGYVVSSVRIITENGKEVKREQLTRSTYKSVPTEVLVGSKVAEETPSPSPEAVPASTPVPADPSATPSQTTEPSAEPSAEPAKTPAPTAEPTKTPDEKPSEPVAAPAEEVKEEA